jgi:hypothetical protein
MNQKARVRVVATVFLVILFTLFATALARHETPKPSIMEDLNSADQLNQRLQKDSGRVTIIALLSPVCPECRHGFTDMQSVLKNIPDDRLRAHIVWLPMFPGDNKGRAQTRTEEFNDSRVSYYWDGDKLTGAEWQKVLRIDKAAWDVYLLYGPNARWDGATPTPAFWMHQLNGVTKAPCLNKSEFETKVKELLASLK